MAYRSPAGQAILFALLYAITEPCGEDIGGDFKGVVAVNRLYGTIDALIDAVKAFFKELTEPEALTLAA